MPRRDPPDHAGPWCHVTNRGLAKRTVVENGHDVEQFVDLAVRRSASMPARSVVTTT